MVLTEELDTMNRNCGSQHVGRGNWIPMGPVHQTGYSIDGRIAGIIKYHDSYVKQPFKWESYLGCEARGKECPIGYAPNLKSAKTIIEVLYNYSFERKEAAKKYPASDMYAAVTNDFLTAPPVPATSNPWRSFNGMKNTEFLRAGINYAQLQLVQLNNGHWQFRMPLGDGSYEVRIYRRNAPAFPVGPNSYRYRLQETVVQNDSQLAPIYLANSQVTADGLITSLFNQAPAPTTPTPTNTPLNTSAPSTNVVATEQPLSPDWLFEED